METERSAAVRWPGSVRLQACSAKPCNAAKDRFPFNLKVLRSSVTTLSASGSECAACVCAELCFQSHILSRASWPWLKAPIACRHICWCGYMLASTIWRGCRRLARPKGVVRASLLFRRCQHGRRLLGSWLRRARRGRHWRAPMCRVLVITSVRKATLVLLDYAVPSPGVLVHVAGSRRLLHSRTKLWRSSGTL